MMASRPGGPEAGAGGGGAWGVLTSMLGAVAGLITMGWGPADATGGSWHLLRRLLVDGVEARPHLGGEEDLPRAGGALSRIEEDLPRTEEAFSCTKAAVLLLVRTGALPVTDAWGHDSLADFVQVSLDPDEEWRFV
jgi:hypothetical protein